MPASSAAADTATEPAAASDAAGSRAAEPVIEPAATEDETRAYLLRRSRRTAAPILKGFIQNPDRSARDRSGPLAEFVRNGDERGLKALLFLHAFISSGNGGWSSTLSLAVWARVFDTTRTAAPRSASTAATKLLTRLESRKLIARARTGRSRSITVTLLRPDGTGAPYTRPTGISATERFISLPNAYWLDGWHDKLDLAATAMLLVALHEKPGFELVSERTPQWYGFSADTAERGLKTLETEGLLAVTKHVRKAPLSPTGLTARNAYHLRGVFSRAAKAPAAAPSAPTPAAPARADGKSHETARPTSTALSKTANTAARRGAGGAA